MRIDILSILPDFFNIAFEQSILKRAQKKGIVEIHIHDIRKYSTNKQKSVDDYQYGGGAGMVMCIQPIDDLISKLKSERNYDEIIYLTPDGEQLNQGICNKLSTLKNIILLCGHYKGIDQRIRDHFISKEISIGDYVLTGGELGAIVLSDAIIRLIPGVISDETSALTDSFQDQLLSPPIYTRPSEYKGWKVPEILLSGDDKKIEKWRQEQAEIRTKTRRPDILKDK
ncbi:MAG TPA: tRNA (guanosine(37)-N1)-methyltransferase TrmD [Flavobacteriales bacterium]|jgi:tRNA (guanine37-N1)-methyltransferase|nr:tRNA (guanosine(37)-N1)-methyltransferase TrmD [Flavobacteriales bacterium]HIL66400.1 tRNA (guanosine(37)-N1)-methyltransferase TrmD [Flavobacteriales bacterium]|tara:strand:+ start:206 stop:886 length:681 start_codon:yes stop_codon:yes gene_type:complete